MSRLKPSHLVCMASAVIGCAVALGLHTTSHRGGDAGSKDGGSTSKILGRTASSTPAGARHKGFATRSQHRAELAQGRVPQTSPRQVLPQRVGGSPANHSTVGTESEWFARAAKVEMEANRELCRLQDLLDLSPDQQQRIFGLLARQSEHWTPGMTAGKANAAPLGDTGIPSDGTLLAELDPTQQEALANEELDRQAWWEEILPQLIAPRLSQDDSTGESDLPAAGVPEVKEFDGSDTLLLE